ncbi:MAG TPA: tryptophan--tRNA ligase [Armatimonadetes bacterium]|mgnify:CR=1 FL=1|nr:tryptophan--tRNA ligase [Armatimonadota bacterium]
MRVLSGVKPSAEMLHLGNWFGAVQQFVQLQETEDNYIFIADYHALTTVQDARQLRSNSLEIATQYMACGLDPARTVLWRQSDVPEVCELTWLLSCVTGMGLLERAHAYKAARDEDRPVSMGLFNYPLLMAADILAYEADVVPVGEDQVQHVEMTRDMAEYFNNTFGETLKLPTYRLAKTALRVPGTDGRKMSKSYGNTLGLFEEEKALKKKVMSIVTDSTPMGTPLDPDNCTVFALHRLFGPEGLDELAEQYRTGAIGYGGSKKLLLERLLGGLAPLRTRYAELKADPGYVREVLRDGAERAHVVARRVTDACRLASGFADPC